MCTVGAVVGVLLWLLAMEVGRLHVWIRVVALVLGTGLGAGMGFGYAGSARGGRIRVSISRAWVPLAMVAVGLVSGAGCGFARHANDVARCNEITAKFGALKGSGSAPAAEALAMFASMIDDAKEGERVCRLAGMGREAEAMIVVRGLVEGQRDAGLKVVADADAADREAKKALRREQRDPGALDPSKCPKGRTLIDTKTGKKVDCTGAPETLGGSDNDDLRARCKSVKDAWMRSDGIDPIIECSGGGPNHQDIKVVVTGAGWEFLGAHGKQRAFATSIVSTYKAHWKTFHGWNGADPAEKQVHIMKMNGPDLDMAATISASGFYVDGEAEVP